MTKRHSPLKPYQAVIDQELSPRILHLDPTTAYDRLRKIKQKSSLTHGNKAKTSKRRIKIKR